MTVLPGAQPPAVAVVVMAKAARPGRTKTRLVPALGAEQAARLYAAMLADRCAQVLSLDGVVPAIAFAPDPDPTVAGPRVPEGFERVEQPASGGLGAGLEAAARAFLARGLPVVLLDSDSPTLPVTYLVEAVRRLRSDERCDVVIGPAEDGGYYLLGLRRPAPELFRDIPWSTSEVLSCTLARAAAAGLRVERLPTWWDVDEPPDLERLERSLLEASWPPATADLLRRRAERLEAEAGAIVPERTAVEARLAPWERRWGRYVYGTPWLRVREDRVLCPDGRPSRYSVVECGRCVGVLPFVDEQRVLLVRQHRYVARRVTWEMPTGGVHVGETPEVAAARELAEEAQVRARSLLPLGSYHTSKSALDETAFLFVARGLEPVSSSVVGDDTDLIRVEEVRFSRVLQWVLDGEIVDSMTIIAVLRAALAARG